MTETFDIEKILTNLEGVQLDTVPSVQIEQPRRGVEATTNPLLVPSLLVDARLSPETFEREVERLDRMARKKRALRQRKPYTRKPGTRHPKKKEATKRRRRKRVWEKSPFGCIIHGYGTHEIDKEKWDQYIAPLWVKYCPEDLSVKKYRGYGMKGKPFTIYTMDVVHKKEGIVYSGNGQELYDLSCSQT